jgi:FAD/FMN-containing dehydrogenase
MVLANGTAITASESKNKDLFWAIRGAGHNFGVYTELKIKIYDRNPKHDNWTVTGFTYTHDKLEEVFTISNKWLAAPDRPAEFTHFGVFLFDPVIDVEMVSPAIFQDHTHTDFETEACVYNLALLAG